jgi:hypothetical protein
MSLPQVVKEKREAEQANLDNPLLLLLRLRLTTNHGFVFA